jgi:cell division septation protein DedD
MSREKARSDFDFGPYEDEYRGFDPRDDDKSRGPLILVLAVGVLVIFAAVVWNTYRQGIRPAEGSLPVIARPDSPFKRAPDEAGGVQVAGTDRGFYDLMDGTATEPVDTETEPASPGLEGAPPPLPEPSSQGPVMRTRTTLSTSSSAVAPVPDAAPDVRVASLSPREPRTAGSRPPADLDVLDAQPSLSRFSAGGRYQVQLMAVRSEAAAEGAWDEIRRKDPGLYRDATLDVQRADLGARGVFYRLRVGPFNDRGAASAFCGEVKATGRDCIVVSRSS